MQLWKVMFDLSDYLRDRALAEMSKRFGSTNSFTLAQLKIIRVIERLNNQDPKGSTLRTVSEELKITPGATSTAIDTLVKRGILERSIDPNDRRAVRILLSARFKQLFKTIENDFNGVETEIIKNLTPEELHACDAACTKIAKNLSEIRSNKNI